MSNPQLNALAAEAANLEPLPAAAPGAPAVDQPDELQPAVAGAVAVVGQYACARYRVTPLQPEECNVMAGALLNVARVYGLLDKADPRLMAWLTLGGVSMTIMANRQRLPEPEPEPANANAAAAA